MRILVLIIIALSMLNPTLAIETNFDKNAPSSIRITPPAPKFSDAERQAELAKRRANVAKAMSDNSVMILFSAEPKNYAGDVDFYYRQENNLYYLTNLKQNNATLVLIKNGADVKEILFMPKRNPALETWNGRMYSREQAETISGVKTIVDSRELKDFLQSIKDKKTFTAKDESLTIANFPDKLYLLLPESDKDGNGLAEFRKEYEFSKSINNYKIENAQPIFAELRLVKSPMEIKLVQHAVDITTEAQMRSMAVVGRADWEYEVQAEVEYTFRRRNADYWGYPSIVGCGENATTLHYTESQGAVKKGDLMLMDVGAEYEHYTADVTRTFPVSGKFSKEQAAIYQIVYDAQEAAAKAVNPGATFHHASNAAAEVLKQGLAKLGLITAPNAKYELTFNGKPYEVEQFRLWYMHGWGHWLGMNVHDVGDYAAKLQEGMIFTNEPGIYIREDALDYIPDTPANKAFLAKIRPAFEKYKNIGVRIEDDMLVTKTGVEWMTKALPRSIADIEAFMAKSSKELTTKNSLNQQLLFAVNQ
ncbi:Xaa-Pro aminopeptidase [soil metagenome]